MASIIREQSGGFRVAVTVGGKRRYIRLTEEVGWSNARKFAGYAQRLANHPSRRLDELPKDLAEWMGDLKPEYLEKLALAELAERQNTDAPRLASFIADYLATRTDVKADTRRGLENSRDELLAYFGGNRDMRAITVGDAQEFLRWMSSDKRELDNGNKGKLGPNTAKRRAGRAKQFFAHAVRKGILSRNPFDGLRCRVGGSPERLRFIPAATIEKVLAQITDPEFRAVVVLARWGGLRIPSEIGRMKWGDVNFATKRMLVRVPKLEHIEGKGTRTVPLFPEVEKALLALYSEPFGAEEKVFPRLGHAAMNLRTQFERYILRAGVEPWPKLWQNLRATRATELAEQYPSHVATAWMGHTQAIAEAHYWQTRESYFDAAVNPESAHHLAHHLAHHEEAEEAGSSRKQENGDDENRLVFQDISGSRENLPETSMASVGLEPTRFRGGGF